MVVNCTVAIATIAADYSFTIASAAHLSNTVNFRPIVRPCQHSTASQHQTHCHPCSFECRTFAAVEHSYWLHIAIAASSSSSSAASFIIAVIAITGRASLAD